MKKKTAWSVIKNLTSWEKEFIGLSAHYIKKAF